MHIQLLLRAVALSAVALAAGAVATTNNTASCGTSPSNSTITDAVSWYSCGYSPPKHRGHSGEHDQNDEALDPSKIFDCAMLKVPLCYSGVCTSTRMIEIFVKRLRANKTLSSGEKPRALVLVEGGPGYSSYDMEDSVKTLKEHVDGTVDFYMFDHRGTGRSELLECAAVDSLSGFNPEDTAIPADKLLECVDELHEKYGDNAAAFGAISAAMDVRYIIDRFLAQHDVHIIGYSYGTYVLQRILQLQIPQVIGYIFDSVDTLSLPDDAMETGYSHWNQFILPVSRRLLEYCYDDPKCPLEFKSRETVIDEVNLELYHDLDTSSGSPCTRLLQEINPNVKPSLTIRRIIDVTSLDNRIEGLHTLALLQSCSAADVRVLRERYAELLSHDSDSGSRSSSDDGDHKPDPIHDNNRLLYAVIVSSERWARPSPTAEQRLKWYRDGPFSIGWDDFSEFCILTGAKDPACGAYTNMTRGRPTFSYARDAYYTRPLVLPPGASALTFAGGLDFPTPVEMTRMLHDKLQGGRAKRLVEFPVGTHCTGEATEIRRTAPCYTGLVASFVMTNGDLGAMDFRCLQTLPPMSLDPELID